MLRWLLSRVPPLAPAAAAGGGRCGCCAGILLWSIACIEEGRDVLAAALFALLLNMKHLFACLGPLYFVYLLRHYCR